MPIHSRPNDWGGNSISKALYNHLEAHLPEGKTILELGSGWGTSKLMEKWNVWSIEDNKDWFKKYNPQSFLVPMSASKGAGWYRRDILEEVLKGLEYDALLIDGPWYGRHHFPDHLDLFDTSVLMLFDDIDRAEGRDIIRRVSTIIGRDYFLHRQGQKGFGVIYAVQR